MMHHPQEEKKDDDDVMITSQHNTLSCRQDDGASTSSKYYATPTSNDVNTTNTNNIQNKEKKKSPLLLLLCATGITSCYLWYGTVQEHLFQIDNANKESGHEKQSITLFLLATGTFSSYLLALVWIGIGPLLLSQNNGTEKSRVVDGRLNHPLLALTSVTYLSAMAASNESLHYVSYPTCVLAKSSKLIPTMVVGWLVDKYRSWRRGILQNNDKSTPTSHQGINRMEWLGAALITIGILLFQYIQLQKQSNNHSNHHHDGGEKEEKGDSPYGLALLGLSLFMDGLLGACQSTLKQKHQSDNTAVNNKSAFRPPSAMETMLYINLYATLILIPCSYYAGQFQHGMSMLLFPSNIDTITTNQAENTSKLLLQLNLSASLGQVFIFLTIHHFSPLTCTTVTTTRKFFTILLSVYKFGHVLDVWQWSSVGLVFGGLYLEIMAKFIEEKGDGGGRDGKKQKEE
jgi:UDP-galactose transporter B1